MRENLRIGVPHDGQQKIPCERRLPGAFGRCRLIRGGFNSCVGLSVETFACVSWMVSRLRQEVVTPGSW